MIETVRSKQLWAICTRFNLLPNDPRIRELDPFQCVWIIANMNEEAKRQKQALDGDKEIYTIDPENFDLGAFQALEGLAHNGRTS